jgi:hypothetical protein
MSDMVFGTTRPAETVAEVPATQPSEAVAEAPTTQPSEVEHAKSGDGSAVETVVTELPAEEVAPQAGETGNK